MIRVWRICREALAADSLAGHGGLFVSGRWHHRGQPIVYTSATPSLAALEVLVHADAGLAPADLQLIEIALPDGLAIETCDPIRITPDWSLFPAPVALQDFGSAWLAERRTAVLSVPSALLPIERNHLLNPAHPHARAIRVVRQQPFAFDRRLLRP